MVLLNKQGTNLVMATTDKVVITYNQNGQTQTIPCLIGPLDDGTTGQRTTKYGGLAVGCSLGDYSIRQANPVKTFQVMVNNQAAGTIYYDLQPDPARTSTGVQNCFKVVSFQLNTIPVQTDDTVMPFAAILHCNL